MGDTLGEPYPSIPDTLLYIKGEADTGIGDDDARAGIVIAGWLDGRLLSLLGN